MLESTIIAVRAILTADPSVTPAARADFIKLLRHGPTQPQPTPANDNGRRVLSRATVAEMLSKKLRTVDHLAAQGVLRKVKLPGRKRCAGFLQTDVEKLLAEMSR